MPSDGTPQSLDQVVFSTAVDGIITIDDRSIIQHYNPAAERMFGYAASEVVGQDVKLLMPTAYQPSHGSHVQRYIDTGERKVIGRIREFEGRRKDGSTFPVNITVGEWAPKDGVRWFVSVIRDITELKDREKKLIERQRELELANRELDSFTYSVSHDLRAPLRAIDGFARILSEEHASRLDDEGLRVLGVVRTNVDRMGHLIDDLLEFSRSGRKSLEHARVNMTSLARHAIEEASGVEEGRSIECQVTELPDAQCDESLMRQVWANLIVNAVKYTRGKEPALITVSGHADEHELIYSVADNGVGFDMAYVEKLFGVFQRLHSASSFEGTGVGLALVQRIVGRHGGRVWAEGRPDQGATFYFALAKREV